MTLDEEVNSRASLEASNSRERLSSAELIQLAETLYEYLRAIGIGNSIDNVGKVLQRGGDLEKALVAAVSQISSAKLEQVARMTELELRKEIVKRRRAENRKVNLELAVLSGALFAVVGGTGYVAVNLADVLEPTWMVDKKHLALMASITIGLIGGNYLSKKGDSERESFYYGVVGSIIVTLIGLVALYLPSVYFSETEQIDIGTFTSKLASITLLILTFIIGEIHLMDKADQRRQFVNTKFDTLHYSTQTVSETAFYLRLFQRATREDKNTPDSINATGETFRGWLQFRITNSPKVVSVDQKQPSQSEIMASLMVRTLKRDESDENQNPLILSNHQLRFLLQSNGAWAYGVGCWLMQLDEAEYLSFKEALKKELADVLSKDRRPTKNDVNYSRKKNGRD